MEVQSAIAFDTDELDRLKASNLLKDFVSVQQGNWNHGDWEDFINSVRELGYSLPADVIGAELEMEKAYYWKVKTGEILVPESTIAPETVVARPAAEATACETEALVCEKADDLVKPDPYDVRGPSGPGMPTKHESFDPIAELENAVITEEKRAVAEPVEKKIGAEPAPGAGSWENVNFESLSREERAAYMKDQLKKKLGEG